MNNLRTQETYKAIKASFKTKKHPKIKMIGFRMKQGNRRPMALLTKSWDAKQVILVKMVKPERKPNPMDEIVKLIDSLNIDTQRLLDELHKS